MPAQNLGPGRIIDSSRSIRVIKKYASGYAKSWESKYTSGWGRGGV